MKPAPSPFRPASRFRSSPALAAAACAAALASLVLPGAAAPGSASAASAAPAGQEGTAADVRYARAKEHAALRNLGDVHAHQVLEPEAGALLAVHGAEEAGWLRVEVPGGVPVWVFGKYLKESAVPGVYEVTGNGVNVRPRAAGGQANYPLGQLYEGDQVALIGRADPALPLAEDWVQIWSPPGIRAWIRAADVEPLAASENGSRLWSDALAALASAPRDRAPASRGPAAGKESAGSGDAKQPATSGAAKAEPTASELAMDRLEAAEALFVEQRTQPMPDFPALRAAFQAVVQTAPSSPAGRRARERLEHLGVMEQAAKLKAELETERERRSQELLDRQEEAWDKARRKDPLGQRFAGRGVLERRERVGNAPRYFLRFGGEDVCEVICTTGRYDLDLYSGYDLGVQGGFLRATPVVEAGTGGAKLAVLDAARLRVLAKR